MELRPWRKRSSRPEDPNGSTDLSVPAVWIDTIEFNDGSSVALKPDDVVLIVGPNNSGKSATLRAIAGKLRSENKNNPVVRKLLFQTRGTVQDVISWLEKVTRIVPGYFGDKFELFESEVSRRGVEPRWTNKSDLDDLAPFFCMLLDAAGRLRAANPPDSISLTEEGAKHPIHLLQWNDSVERRISGYFKRAFGSGLIVHRNAGKTVPIMLGDPPELGPGKDRHSIEYVVALEKMPAIHTQGDGMRSFLGVLLFSSVGPNPILLIDEPEAFLHPPQARHLGSFLVNETETRRQLFIATHSGDVLRGVLDPDSDRVRVLRIRREGDRNYVRQLENAEISKLWGDPLLRYSNILDGLFHERVIVCEGDADCRFYGAITDSIFETQPQEGKKPDIMFTHCGGKARVPLIVKSLRALDVPVCAVLDFDILNSENPLDEIVAAAGGNWSQLRADWQKVQKSVNDKKPQLNLAAVKAEIDKAVNAISSDVLTDAARKSIQNALRASSPWSTAKTVGAQYVPNGDASNALNRLLAALENLGIFIVPVGELEQFVKSVGGHGPQWVAQALQKDIQRDPELESAKAFVRKFAKA